MQDTLTFAPELEDQVDKSLFVLTGSERAWLVERGHVDLFVVALKDGKAVGARNHIWRAETGDAAFGLPPGSLCLLAVPSEDARVRLTTRLALSNDIDVNETDVVDRWITALARSIQGAHVAAQYESLDAFHAAFLDAHVHQIEERKRTGLARLQAQTNHDQHLALASARRLASPLRPTATLLPHGSNGDNLLAACQAIGRPLQIDFRAGHVHLPTESQTEPRKRLGQIARLSRVRYRGVMLRDKWWRADQGPLLAFRNGAAVALLPEGASSYVLFDPASGSRTSIRSAEGAQLEPLAYQFYRSFPARAITPVDIVRFGLHGCGRDLVTLTLLGILAACLALLPPILTGLLFDNIIPHASKSQLLEVTIALLFAALATTLFALARNYAAMRAEGRASNALQAAIWDRLLDLPARFFRNYSSGDLAMRASGIDTIRQVLSSSTLASCFSGLFSIFNLALLFYYSVPFACVAMLMTSIAVGSSSAAGYFQLRLQRRLIESSGKLSSLVLQILQGMPKIRVANAEKRAYAAWVAELAKQNDLSIKTTFIGLWLGVFNAVFSIATTMTIFYVMSATTAPGGLSTGQFIAFATAFGQLLGGLSGLSGSLLGALSVVPIYERAKPILESVPESCEGKSDCAELAGHIEVSHVHFRYHPDGPLVLKDVSLAVLPGQFVAIVGSSGCGKSTLMRLLLGFERPEAGAVYYDSHDLSGLDLQAVRRQMGVVIQNAIMQPGDIRTNILGSSTLTLAHAWEAARLAGLDEDIEAMPMGMHTFIGEGGQGLSGGQRQRLLIARALVRHPRVLLFDEATSALDNRTQNTVSESLRALKATRVVIAHRLSTIQEADRIFVIDQGSIVQTGTYAELISQPGVFSELAKRQMERQGG
jgi:NHLM bacteriocin system ABC transporter ATP-binding protein